MDLSRALADDILSVLPFGGRYKPAHVIAKLVAPQREKEVRLVIRDLAKRRHLDVNRGGNGWPAYWLLSPVFLATSCACSQAAGQSSKLSNLEDLHRVFKDLGGAGIVLRSLTIP